MGSNNKIITISTDHTVQRFTTTPHLHGIMLSAWASMNICTFCKSQSVPRCEKMNLNIVYLSEICRSCWKSTVSVGPEGLFLQNCVSLTAQDKQGTHEELSQDIKTCHWPSRKHQDLGFFENSGIIWWFVNICNSLFRTELNKRRNIIISAWWLSG